MEDLLRIIDVQWQEVLAVALRILLALTVFVLTILIGRGLGRMVQNTLRRARISRTHTLFFRNLVRWFVALLGLAAGLNILGLETALSGFIAGSGVAAVILGFAFREIGENFLAGLFLAFSRPFDVGDLILSEGIEGEVQEIELRNTHIRTADGRDIFIPNAQLFNRPLTNYTKDGLRRPAFTVGIDYVDDCDRARALLRSEVEGVPGVLAVPGPSANIKGLESQYVELEISFWINTFQAETGESLNTVEQENFLARTRSEAMERCRRALLENGFTVSANVSTAISLTTAPSTAETPAPAIGGE